MAGGGAAALAAALLALHAPAWGQAAEPAVAPGLATQAKEAAEATARTFAEALRGRSLLLGATETQPQLTLQYHATADAAQGTVEEYSGDPARGFLASLESPAAEGLLPLDDAGVWLGSMGFRFTTTYGTFQLQQTLQHGTAGKSRGGTVQGDFLGFAVPVEFRVLRNSEVLPFAIGWAAGLGKAFVRYQAPLRYSVDGQDYAIDVQSDGYYPRNMIFTAIDLRVWNVLLRLQAINMTGGESYARYRGRRVFTFTDDFTLNLKTLAYVWNF